MTPTVIVTGSAGLVGSESVRFFCEKGFRVIGIDNDMRRYFFGDTASTQRQASTLQEEWPDLYTHVHLDVRDEVAVDRIFGTYNAEIRLVIHAAAQPSHDWAATEPLTDFSVNATATLVLLEATRKYCPEAVFLFTSTNKVYGDQPNSLSYEEHPTRWELPETHEFSYGISERMSIDQSMHSVFGASKVAADVMVQEYGRYFGLRTGVFRGGCLTGPNHSGAELHGFLAYLMKCAVTQTPYTIFGYKGKQVRDNIHSADLVSAFYHYYLNPGYGEVYNIGGGRLSNCSILEAIAFCENICGHPMKVTLVDSPRRGDHIWWISDIRKFETQCPDWKLTRNISDILRDIHDKNRDYWLSGNTAASSW